MNIMDMYILPNYKVKLFNYPNNQYFVFTYNSAGEKQFMDVNEDAFHILKVIDGCKTNKEIFEDLVSKYEISLSTYKEFLQESINRNILLLSSVPNNREFEIIGDGETLFPRHIGLEITNQCNAKCKYCYNESSPKENSKLSLEKTSKVLELFSEYGVNTIEITGGEPLIHDNIVEILKLLFYEYQFEKVSILTNGIYINNNIIYILKNNKDKIGRVQVSLDGSNERINEKIRQTKNTFSKSISTIKKLIENKISVDIDVIANKDNINDLKHICELTRGLGVRSISISHELQMGRGEDSYEPVCENLLKEIIEDLILKYEDLIENKRAHEKYNDYENFEKNCGAGWRSVTVDTQGNVRICPTSSITLGNLFMDEYFSIFNSYKTNICQSFVPQFKDIEKICSNCSFDCGGCLSKINYYNNKRIEKGDGICEVAKNNNLDLLFYGEKV